MNNNLSFSHNWNKKLGCDYFTTLRLSGWFNVGDVVVVNLENKILGTAKVVAKQAFNIGDLNPVTCYLDTGYGKTETVQILKRMYPQIPDIENQVIYLYTLGYISRTAEQKQLSTATQAQLF